MEKCEEGHAWHSTPGVMFPRRFCGHCYRVEDCAGGTWITIKKGKWWKEIPNPTANGN